MAAAGFEAGLAAAVPGGVEQDRQAGGGPGGQAGRGDADWWAGFFQNGAANAPLLPTPKSRMKTNCGRQLTRSLLPATKRDLEKLEQKLETFMSKFTDWADAEDADIAGIKDLLNGIAAGIANLDSLISAFQNSPGTLSDADQ